MTENQHTGSLILDALPTEARESLINQGHKRSYQKGEVIFSRGDEGAWAFLIESGMIEISVMPLNGRKSVLNHIKTGEILKKIALLDGQPRSAEATDELAHR